MKKGNKTQEAEKSFAEHCEAFIRQTALVIYNSNPGTIQRMALISLLKKEPSQKIAKWMIAHLLDNPAKKDADIEAAYEIAQGTGNKIDPAKIDTFIEERLANAGNPCQQAIWAANILRFGASKAVGEKVLALAVKDNHVHATRAALGFLGRSLTLSEIDKHCDEVISEERKNLAYTQTRFHFTLIPLLCFLEKFKITEKSLYKMVEALVLAKRYENHQPVSDVLERKGFWEFVQMYPSQRIVDMLFAHIISFKDTSRVIELLKLKPSYQAIRQKIAELGRVEIRDRLGELDETAREHLFTSALKAGSLEVVLACLRGQVRVLNPSEEKTLVTSVIKAGKGDSVLILLSHKKRQEKLVLAEFGLKHAIRHGDLPLAFELARLVRRKLTEVESLALAKRVVSQKDGGNNVLRLLRYTDSPKVISILRSTEAALDKAA